MKNKLSIYLLATSILTLSGLISSCTKDFVDINSDPNSIETAEPQSLLPRAIKQVVAANMNRSQRVNNELMQVTVNMGDTEGKIFRYEIRTSEADYLWNTWYTELTNFKDIYKGGEAMENNTYMAISLICQSWIYSLLADTYGDVPYFNSNRAKEGVFLPEFNTQKDIYTDIFMKLEQANELLKTGADVTTNEPLYAGKAANWRKFGNSLYLRLLLRVSGKSEVDAAAKIQEIVETKAANYPIFASNTESAILKWTGSGAYVSPFATWRDVDWNTPKLATFFVDNLNERSDPRIQKWATLFQGEYNGVPSGYPVGQAPVAKSALQPALRIEPLLGNIMNYSELQLILAEAAAKGWISAKPAKTYYETGVTNAITLWGLTAPNGYLGFQKVKWDDNYSLDQKMELIHLQKYYAMFFTDLQQWFEYRRTGHPVLPNGGGLDNNGIMPARLMYPVYVQSANSKNYRDAVAIQGPDVISTQVWWQKP